MAADNSFDIVCKVDKQEVKNAIQQAMKEIQSRFDFRGSKTEIKLTDDGAAIELTSADETNLKSAVDVLEGRMVKRKISLKALNKGKIEDALAGTYKLRIDMQNGIPTDKAREIVKMVKSSKLKVQTAIQGDQIRVSGKKKDDLQSVMSMLRESSLDIAMDFTNYR